jgi:hypothetical protein
VKRHSDYLRGIDVMGIEQAVIPLKRKREAPQAGSDTTIGLSPFPIEEDEFSEIEGRAVTEALLPSIFEGVSDEDWTVFVKAMHTAMPSAISSTNAMGMFEMKPKRLADLGIMHNIKCTRSPTTGCMAWVGDFVSPLTAKSFLGTPRLQYQALCSSMKDYVQRLRDGSISHEDVPEDLTLSGVLAILHRLGPQGLRTWNDTSKPRFEGTEALVARANGVF